MSRVEIASEGAALEPGESARMVCPFCGGGHNKERSLSIKRDEETGLILYHCFRANCGEAGVLGGSRNLTRIRLPAEKKFEPWDDKALQPIADPDMVPTGVIHQVREWGLDPYHGPRWYYDPRDDRICMPILGPLYDTRGYVRRAYRTDTYPKALIGRTDEQHPLVAYHWALEYSRPASRLDRIICVEDIPSAERLCRVGVNSVALLGCTPSDEALEELGQVARRNDYTVVFALDADASAQAIKLQRKFSMRARSRVRFLDKDVKNMTPEELHAWLTNET